MRLLLLHHRNPYPLTSGMDKVRFNLVRMLSTAHRVTLVIPVDSKTREEDLRPVRAICQELITVPVVDRLDALAQRSAGLFLDRLLRLVFQRLPTYIYNWNYPEMLARVADLAQSGRFDAIQALSEVTAGTLRAAPGLRPHILGPVDDTIDSARTDMQVTPWGRKKVIWYLEMRARQYYQPRACADADRVFFFSEKDQAHLSKLAGGLPQAERLPVVVEEHDFPPPSLADALAVQEPFSLVFVGGMGSIFNQDAVLYFCDQIFPRILAHFPQTHLYVVGQSPMKKVLALGSRGNITVTGAVPDVRPYLERAAVYISPVRAGTGLKTKIIEALANGKAIVATPEGVQGVWNLGEGVIDICPEPEQFAGAVCRLLADPALRLERGQKARLLYEQCYTFPVVLPQVLEAYARIEKNWEKQR